MNITPAQLAALTGLSVENQRAWERRDIWNGRFIQTDGGQRRFRPVDVVYVATVRVLSETGLDLRVCAGVAQEALAFILTCLNPTKYGYPDAEFAFFIWPTSQSTDHGLYEYDGLEIANTNYRAIRLKDVNSSTVYSKIGGVHFFPSGVASALPQAVRDLIIDEA